MSQNKKTKSTWDTNMQVTSSLCIHSLSDSIYVVSAPDNYSRIGIGICNDSAWEILTSISESFDKVSLNQWYDHWGPQKVNAVLEDFVNLGILVSSNKSSHPLTEASSTLGAWLHITNKCNMRCSYCYLSHDNSDMPGEIGKSAVGSILNSALIHGYRNVKLKYAGGEPLLRYPFVVDLHQHARSLAEKLGLTLDGVVLSNGTLLTKDIVKSMKRWGLHLMISLDGIGASHNRQRTYVNGQGTCNDVIRAVELAQAYDLVPDISITVTRHNIDGLPMLITWVLEQGLPFSLNFYRENRLSVSKTDLKLEEKHIIAGMRAAYQVIEQNLPSYSLLASLIDRANLSAPHLRPCSVGSSYIVFDTQGRIAKCQMDMDATITDFHNPDPLTCIREADTGIQNISVDEKAECKDCQWRYWCAGGCVLQTYRATGRYNTKSPYCNIYKALYPEVVRLEGLRLLNYADQKIY
jgi:uncharacterized protein